MPVLKLFLEQEKSRSNCDIKTVYDPVLLGWTNLLFGKIFNYYRVDFLAEENKESGFTEQVLFFIDNNYMKPDLSLQMVANTFGYNPSYLSRTFKKYFFVPLNKYIRSVRIQKFVSMYFMAPNANILKLAMDCGFSTASAFYRAFREETNTTPMLFKSNNITKHTESASRSDML
ncbi:MAG: helix-turn-helix transcriptional regulator [Candidatus Scatosoma sp.]